MRFLMLFFMFLCFGAFFIVSNENLHLNQSVELSRFGELYTGWLRSLFDNGKSISGYVVKFEWLPDTPSRN